MRTQGDVDVTQNLTVSGGLSVGVLTYPNADGTSNQVIETDGAGNLSFVSISTTDHGTLTGLDDETDHTWASLVDGTRPFTGTVGGITPVADADLSTKLFVTTTSGHLQSEIDALLPEAGDVDSVNDITGAVLITGTQNVTTQTLGQTVTVTGPDLTSFGTTAELLTVSGHLQTQITTNEGDITTNAGDISDNTTLVTTTSGHLQTQIDAVEGSDVDSVNAQTGAVTITGTTGVNTATAGGVITLTTQDDEIDHDALLNYDSTEHFTEASIDHTAITNIGTNSHADIDSHVSDAALHFTEGSIDHTAITNVGSNTHATIDTHLLALAASGVATDVNVTTNTADISTNSAEILTVSGHLQTEIDALEASDVDSINDQTGTITITGSVGVDTITAGGVITLNSVDSEIDHDALLNFASNEHFTEASIDHTAITNIGSNSHAALDTHVSDATLHFTEGSIDHTAITNIGVNTHAQIDTHLGALAASGVATDANVTTNVTDISTNATNIDANTVSGTATDVNVATNVADIGTNVADISALTTSGIAQDVLIAANSAEILTVSGHLQTEIDAVGGSPVTSVNAVTGAVLVTGTQNVTTQTAGQTITVTGPDLSTYSTTAELVTVSGHLQGEIDGIDVGITTVNSENGPGITIAGGTNLSAVTTADTVTLNVDNPVANATEWNGAVKTVSTSAPSGGSDDDIWLVYTP